jgi:hypothetical protein
MYHGAPIIRLRIREHVPVTLGNPPTSLLWIAPIIARLVEQGITRDADFC